MFEVIAVATDGSDTARQAVDAAFDLAGRFGAEVVILTAFADDAGAEGGWTSNSATQAEWLLAEAEEEAESRGLRCSSAMSGGAPGEVLVELAERCRADVLVVGNKGMQRKLLGSVPNTITHRAPCDVFVVKTV
jgi:nucleotide-binding universal stress UspA family protein